MICQTLPPGSEVLHRKEQARHSELVRIKNINNNFVYSLVFKNTDYT